MRLLFLVLLISFTTFSQRDLLNHRHDYHEYDSSGLLVRTSLSVNSHDDISLFRVNKESISVYIGSNLPNIPESYATRISNHLVTDSIELSVTGWFIVTTKTNRWAYCGYIENGRFTNGTYFGFTDNSTIERQDIFRKGHYCWSAVAINELKTNLADEQGKQEMWVYTGADRPESGIPSNGKVEEGRYENGCKTGIWVKYHNDGVTPRLIGEYVNNCPQGTYSKFNPDGSIREEGIFNTNKYVRTYNDADIAPGKIKDGTEEEKARIKTPEFADSPYTKGIRWNKDGFNKVYNTDNEIWIEGIFKGGKLCEGQQYIYDRDGILLVVQIFKDGVFYSTGQL